MPSLSDLGNLWPELAHWSYLVIFLIAALEAFPVIGTLVPGGFLIVAAGFAATTGALDPWGLAVAAGLGAIAGDAGAYEVGHRWGTRPLARYRGSVFLPEGVVTQTERAVRNHTWAAVVLGRFNTFTRALAPLVSGTVGVPRARFLLWNVLGGLAWAFTHIWGGFFFGQGFLAAYDRFGRDALVVLVLLAAGWWAFKKWRLLREERLAEDSEASFAAAEA